MAVALRQSWFPAAAEFKALTRDGLAMMKDDVQKFEELLLLRIAGTLLSIEHRRRHPLEFLLHHLPSNHG